MHAPTTVASPKKQYHVQQWWMKSVLAGCLLALLSASGSLLVGCRVFKSCVPRKAAMKKNAAGQMVKHGKEWLCFRGTKLEVGTYNMGKKEGEFREWKQKGVLYPTNPKTPGSVTFSTYIPKSYAQYSNGILNGVAMRWYDNGQKKSEMHFVKGRAHGKGTLWYKSGAKKQESFFRDGKETKRILYHPTLSRSVSLATYMGKGTGETLYTIKSKEKSIGTYPHKRKYSFRGHGGLMTVQSKTLWKYVRYDAKGKKKSEHFESGGSLFGVRRTWHPNGQLKSKALYYQGNIYTKRTEWYANGKKKRETMYERSRKNGPSTTWCEHGYKHAQGMYRGGKKHGKWTYWHHEKSPAKP